MLRHFMISALLLLPLTACGGGTESGDTGAPSIDAPGGRTDAPADRVDAPGLDAPGLDAPGTVDDAPIASGDDAPIASGDDAPSDRADAPSADDASMASDAAAAGDARSGRVDAPISGSFCGGIAGLRCPRDQYCDESCLLPDAGGVCREIPAFCTDDVAPVCGCDGTTYTNACMAAMAGVAVRSDGACPGVADCRADGCRGGLECCTGGRSAGSCYDPRCLACCM